MPSKKFPIVKTQSLEWVFVNRNRTEDLNELRRRYRYHPIDLQDILPPVQRPKVVARDGYVFMILLYPLFDRDTRQIRTTEVDLFISQDRLVTVNVDNYEPLNDLFHSCRSMGAGNHVCMNGDVTQLLYAILNTLLMSVFPMLVHINADIDRVEKRLFNSYEKDLIQELLRIKTNVVNVRKTMQGHKMVITHLLQTASGYFPIHRLDDYFDELVDHTKEIWETLEVQKESVDALHETNQSLIDFRSNEIMKTLTIFSAIILPLTFIAAVFTMHTKGTPLLDHPYSFWIVMTSMIVIGFGMLGYFKYRKWL